MKYLYLLVGIVTNLHISYANLKDDILVEIGSDGGEKVKTVNEVTVFTSARNVIFAFLGITAVAMILWAGIKYLTNTGKEDEFKSSALSLIHIAIGLALIPAAYFAVRLLFNLKF